MAGTTKVHKFSGGRLILGATNFSSPETNCGGTQLGTVQNVSVRIHEKLEPLTAEEWGSAIYDAIVLDQEITLSITATGWDENLVASALYGGATASGTPVVTYPSAVGGFASVDKGITLLWLPNDNAADPAFFAYNAIPWSVTKPISFNGRKPAVVTATFLCLRNTSNLSFKTALLGAL